MGVHVLVIQGHPDTSHSRLCWSLAEAYAAGARAAGHEVQELVVAELDFTLLRSKLEWEAGQVPPGLVAAQAAISWANHLVLVYPLWLGEMPALFKGFLEQVARPGFALPRSTSAHPHTKLLVGRSARIVVTMGMPALVYRWYFRAHSLKSLKRNILNFVGISPVRSTVIGGVGGMTDRAVARHLNRLRKLGQQCI